MGQKIDPRGFRLALTRDWSSVWYANGNNFAALLLEDIKIREFLLKKIGRKASVGRIKIERPTRSVKVTIHTARPGVIIGKKGEGIEALKQQLQAIVTAPLHLNVEEIKKPELNAQIVADQIAMQLEKRIAFRRAMKKAMQTTMKAGASGLKITSSGRLNGIEIARSEWYREGRVPLHTMRAIIDYATSRAYTTYGVVGIKVWIYKGDIKASDTKYIAKYDPTMLKEKLDSEQQPANAKRKKQAARNNGNIKKNFVASEAGAQSAEKKQAVSKLRAKTQVEKVGDAGQNAETPQQQAASTNNKKIKKEE